MATMVMAQTENNQAALQEIDNQRYKNFDGFLLDMRSMLDMPSYFAPPSLTYRPFDAMMPSVGLQVNSDAIRINPNITYKG